MIADPATILIIHDCCRRVDRAAYRGKFPILQGPITDVMLTERRQLCHTPISNIPQIFPSIRRRCSQPLNTILAHDSGSGDCKCRSYPAEASNHTHLLIEISMLSKPHRDEAFTLRLRDAIAAAVKCHLKQSCYISLAITYSDAMYLTDRHDI